MPDQPNAGGGHSLEAEILLHFAKAGAEADAFASKIESMSKAFKEVSEAAKTVDNNVGRKLHTIMEQLNGANALNISAKDVQNKLENALLDAFLQSKINITGPSGNELKVAMTQKDWEPIEGKLRTAINKGLRGLTVDATNMKPLKLNDYSLRTLQNRLHDELNKALEQHLNFKWETGKGEDALKMHLTKEHLATFMRSIQDKLVKVLADPEMFELDKSITDEKIRIGSEEFNKAVSSARTALKRAMNALTFDTTPLDEMNNTKFDSEALQGKLNNFVAQLSKVNEAMGSVQSDISQPQLQKIMDDLKGFKQKFTKEINSIASVAMILHGSLSKQNEAAAASVVTDVMPDYAKMREALSTELQTFARTMSSKVQFKAPKGQNASGFQVVLPEEVITEAESAIRRVLVDQARHMVTALSGRGGSGLTAQDISQLDKDLYAQSKVLLNSIIGQAETMVNSFVNGLKDNQFKSFGKAEQAAINRNLQTSMTTILTQFSTAMKQLTELGGISSDNTFRMAARDLDKEMRSIVAQRMGKRVGELRNINTGTPDKGYLVGADGVGVIMDANLQMIFKKFHDKINTATRQIVADYQSAIDGVPIQTDYSPVFYLTSKMEGLQKDITSKIRSMLDLQFEALGKALKDMQTAPVSFGYDPKEIKLNGRQQQQQQQATPGQRPSSISGVTTLVDPRYPTGRMPRGFNNLFELLHEWEKQAVITVEKVKNKFHKGGLTGEHKEALHNFLDNDYMRRVREAIGNSGSVGREATQLSLRDTNLMLKYMVEQFRKLQFGDSTANAAANMKNNLSGLRQDARLDAEGIKTRFLDKLNPQQFEELERYLDNYQAKVERLAKSPLINEKDIADAKVSMRDLARELETITKGFDRIRKETAMSANTDKLSNKLNNLIVGSQLPVNKIQKLGDLIEAAHQDPTQLGAAKDYYADLVRENRKLQADLRRSETERQRADRRAMTRAESDAYREDARRNRDAKSSEELQYQVQRMDYRRNRLVGSQVAPAKLAELDSLLVQAMTDPRKLSEAKEFYAQLVAENRKALAAIRKDETTAARQKRKDETDAYREYGQRERTTRDVGLLNGRLDKLRQLGRLDLSAIQEVQNAINAVSPQGGKLTAAKDALARALESQAEQIRQEKVAGRLNQSATNRLFYSANQDVIMDKMRDRYFRKLNDANYARLDADLNTHAQKVSAVVNAPAQTEAQAKALQDAMRGLNVELAELARRYNRVAQDQTFEGRVQSLRESLAKLADAGRNSAADLQKLQTMINGAVKEEDVTIAKAYVKELEKIAAAARKRGDLIGQSNTLQGTDKAVFGEQLAAALRATDALKGYEITQLNVNNSTNSWSARMRDASGNLRTMSGTIDKVTGELFKHAEALQLVAANAKIVPSYNPESPALTAAKQRAANRYSMQPGTAAQRQYYPDYMTGELNTAAKTLASESKGFMTSVMNTMRYIMAGSIIGGPSMLISQGYEANKEFEYQMTRAKANFMVKDPEMEDAAEHRMVAMLRSGVITQEQYDDPASHAKIKAEQQAYLKNAYMYDATEAVQNQALAYAVSTPEAATAYQLASTAFDDPDEALRVASTAMKLKAIEEMPIEDSAGGLSAIATQYGMNAKGIDWAGDMMVMGANLEFTKVQDLLDIQKRAGVSFAQNMPADERMKAFAYATALGSIYTSSTGKLGAQGGTFFKNTFGSPFDPVTSKKFEQMSQRTGLEQLNPWVERTNENGEKVKDQKSGAEMLFAITDVIGKLGADDRNFVQSTYASKWFRNDAAAVQEFMKEMDRASQNKYLKENGGVEGFVNRLMSDVDPSLLKPGQLSPSQVSNALLAQNMMTYKFQEQKLKTMWEVSTQPVFDNLKDEFQSVAATIMSFLNVVKNNAGLFANGIALLGKVGLALGASFAAKKFGTWVDKKYEEDRQESLGKKFNKATSHLNEEAKAVNLRKNIITDHMTAVQNRLNLVNSKRNGLGIENLNAKLEAQNAERQQLVLRRDAIERDGGEGSAEHIAISREIYDKDREIAKTQRNTVRAHLADPKLDQEAKELEKTLKKLQRQMNDVDRQAVSVNTRMELMELAMKDEAFESKNLTTAMTKISGAFSTGSLNAKKFEQELAELGRNAGMSDDHIKKLTNEMDKLNDKFEQDKDIDAYIRKLKELQRQHLLTNSAISNKPINQKNGQNGSASQSALFGMDLMDAVMAHSLLSAAGGLGRGGAGPTPPVPPRAGVWGKIAGGAAAAWGGIKAFGGKIPGVAKLGSKVGKLGSILGKTLKLGGKKVPYLGLALTGMDLFNDFITPMGMTGNEKAQHNANALVGLQKDMQSFSDGGWLNKTLVGLNLGWDSVVRGGANTIFGGTGPKFGDYMESFKSWLSGNRGKDLAIDLESKLGGNQKAADAAVNVKKDLDAMDKTLDLNNDGLKGDTDKTDWKQVISYEDAQTMMGETQTLQGLLQNGLDADHSYQYTKAVLNGTREDSKEMRKLFEDYFKKNIEMLNGILNGTKDENGNVIDEGLIAKRDRLTPGDKSYNLIDTQIKQVQGQIAQLELQGYQKETEGELSDVMSQLNHDLKISGADWSMKKSDAILAGAKDDSTVVKQIQAAMAKDINSRIGITLGELYGLLDKYKDNETQRNTILEQIKELEVQQKDNLVDIKNNLANEKATFNLPDGVQAMSFYEQKMKEGTAKMVSVGAGDVIVNMNVTAGSNQDWEKIGNQVAGIVKRERVNVARELSQQVKTGMQNNYR